MTKAFRINMMSYTNRGNLIKIGDVIRGYRVIGFSNNKNAKKPDSAWTQRKALYAIAEQE